MKKKILVTAAVILICLVSLMAGLYGYSRTDHAKNLLIDHINTLIPGTLMAEQIGVLAAGSFLRLENLQLLDPQGNTCLAFDSLKLDIRLSALFDKVLEIQNLHIDRPRLHITADGSGRINIVEALAAGDAVPEEIQADDRGAAGIPLNIKIRKAGITDGSVLFSDPENTVSADAVTMEVSGADLLQQTAEIFINLSGISLSKAGTAIDIRSFTVAGALKENDINDISIDLDADIGVLTASGSVKDIFNSRKMHLTLEAAAHLDQVSQISENLPDLGGTVDLSMTGTGSLNNPSVQLQIQGQDLEMKQTFEKGRLDVAMNLAEQVLTIAQGQVNLPGARMDFSGSTDLSSLFPEGFLHPAGDPDHLAYEISFDQQGGDFSRLAPWLPGFSGQFSSHGRIRGKGVFPATLAADYELGASLTRFKQDQGQTDPMDADARMSGEINSLRCTLETLVLETRTLRAEASGWYHMGENTLDMDISLASEDMDAATRAFGLFPVTGKLTAAVHAAGPVTALDITADLAGRDLGAAGIVLDLVDLQGKLDNTGRAEINRFLVRGQEMALTASGTAQIFDKGFALKEVIQVSLKATGQINPAQFLAQADPEIDLQYLDTAIAFDLDTNLGYAAGTTLDMTSVQNMAIPVQKIRAQIDLGEKNISVSLENMAELAAALDMEENTYTADLDFRRSDFGPLLSAAGITGIHGDIDGWIRAAGRLPADLPPDVADQLDALKGSLTVTADAGGTVGMPVINADMDLRKLAWDLPDPRITVSDLNGKITVSPEHIRIQNLQTRINGGQISLNGDAGFSGSILQTCRLALDAKNLEIPMAAGSKKTDQVHISDLAADLALDLTPPGLHLKKIGSSNDFFLPVKQITALIDLGKNRLDLQAGTAINLSSVLDPENAHYDLDLTFDNTLVGPFLQTAGFTGTAGTLTGQVRSKGDIGALIPGHILDTAGQAGGTLSITADITDSEKQDTRQMDMALTLSGKKITLPMSSTSPDKENLFMDMLESALDIHLNFAGAEAPASAGASAGSSSAALENSLPVKTIQAVLDLNRTDQKKFLDLSVTMDQTTGLAASFDPATADFDLDLTFADSRLDRFLKTAGIHGIKAVVSGHMLSRGRVNMVLPPEITDNLQPAGGTVTLDADLDGTFARPDVTAQLILSDLSYPVPGINLALSGLNGSVRVSNHRLTIENMEANLGQGSLKMSGDLELEKFIPVSGQARLTADNIAISLEDTAQIAFNTDMTFSGTRENSALTGTVLLLKGAYYRDFNFDLAEALESRKMAATGKTAKTDSGIPVIGKTSLDIDVDYKEPFVLDNNLAFILVEPDIKISGTVNTPVLTGRARVLEGTVMYHKRQFEIQTGIIDFVDPFKTDPEITLNAATSIRAWTIHMDVSGKTDNLKFSLYSDPAETHEDILSLLLIGKTTAELGEGGISYTGVITDKASEMVSEGVESSTPLDTFKVGLDDSGGQGSKVSVTLGKQLSERVKVLYSMQTEDEATVHTNTAEYKMLENVLLRGFNDSKGDFGTEVTLKLEFR